MEANISNAHAQKQIHDATIISLLSKKKKLKIKNLK